MIFTSIFMVGITLFILIRAFPKDKTERRYFFYEYGKRVNSLLKRITPDKYQIENGFPYLILIFFISLATSVYGIVQHSYGEIQLDSLDRAEYGQGNYYAQVSIEAEYQGVELKKKTSIFVRQQELTSEEKQARIQQCIQTLPNRILGENQSLDKITKPLNLLQYDEETGVDILWRSSNVEVIGEDGTLMQIPWEEEVEITLSAFLSIDEQEEEWNGSLRILPAERENTEKWLEENLEKILGNIEDEKTNKIILPKQTDEGITLRWSSISSFETAHFLLLLILGGLIIHIYNKRAPIKKKERMRHDIESQFPDFLNQLIMILSTGLVLSDTLDRIMEGYLKFKHKSQSRKILYEELVNMIRKTKMSNASLFLELIEFGRKMEVREVTRVAVILSDHMVKGNDLIEKLEQERELLQAQEKLQKIEQGKLADTKMMFPLMLILAVLITIVVMPALMQM